MFFLIFFVTAAVSFAGSLQPGPVNIQVLVTGLKAGKNSALQVAAGGCIPELIYSALALMASEWLSVVTDISKYASYLIIIIFLVMGIHALVIKPKPFNTNIQHTRSNYFFSGFGLAMLNPLLFTYWFGMLSVFQAYSMRLGTLPDQCAFVAGTASGAFALLFLVAYAGEHIQKFKLFQSPERTAKITGYIYLLIAAGELVRHFFK
ncbi:MAG TPA: LysE family transporter [Bacteroidia bacterium]|nr:LysE family transporter [Bacteroidia bacterium]